MYLDGCPAVMIQVTPKSAPRPTPTAHPAMTRDLGNF